MPIEKEPASLMEAIVRIATASYEPLVLKYPFMREYLAKYEEPQAQLTLLLTAAGAGSVLATKEGYPGEHDEVIAALIGIDGLTGIIQDFAAGLAKVKDDRKQLALAFPAWIVSRIKGEKPTMEEIKGPGMDMAKLLKLAIRDYETKRPGKRPPSPFTDASCA